MSAGRPEQHTAERPAKGEQPASQAAADGARRPPDQERAHEPCLLDDEQRADEPVRFQVKPQARLREQRRSGRTRDVHHDLDGTVEADGKRTAEPAEDRAAALSYSAAPPL